MTCVVIMNHLCDCVTVSLSSFHLHPFVAGRDENLPRIFDPIIFTTNNINDVILTPLTRVIHFWNPQTTRKQGLQLIYLLMYFF